MVKLYIICIKRKQIGLCQMGVDVSGTTESVLHTIMFVCIYKGIDCTKDCLISQHCYLMVFWTVLSQSEDVSWPKAPIAPSDKLCVPKRGKNTTGDLADEVSDVSPEQLNK